MAVNIPPPSAHPFWEQILFPNVVKQRQEGLELQAQERKDSQAGIALQQQLGQGLDPQSPDSVAQQNQLLSNPDTRGLMAAELDQRQATAGFSETPQQAASRGASEQSAATSLAAMGRDQKKFDLLMTQAVNSEETRLRSEYQAAVRPAVEVMTSVETARSQMQFGGPEAALNSARLFIQQLDKSMITNPEIANLIAQQGLAGQYDSLRNWASGEGTFDDPTRERMLNSMAAIAQVYQTQAQQMVSDMTAVVEANNLELNPANVITMGGFANRDFDLSISDTPFTSTIDPSLVPPGITPVP